MFQVADWSQRKLEIADAFRQAAPLPAEADSDFYTALLHEIGVSTNQDIVPFLQSLAERYRLNPGNVCIEITEETELVTTEATGELIKKIRSFGYTFALDDFSMGHTSLQYLQHNQFDLVKLDGNLVRSILTNNRTKEIINSIVFLSQSLDFKVLAEFVETMEQKEALEQIGCVLYQGYLFSPAVDRDSLISMGNAEKSEKRHDLARS